MTRNNPSATVAALPGLLAEPLGCGADPTPPPPSGARVVLLVGLMGAGKSAIGRRLAQRLGLPFHDADTEIEAAAGCSVAEIFARFGEAAFRDGERRVLRRLLTGPAAVVAAGGGAWMDAQTRALAHTHALSVWLRCPLPVLARRVAGRAHRPLLAGVDPLTRLTDLARLRDPVYAEADIIVDCREEPPDVTTNQVLQAVLDRHAPRRLEVALAARSYEVVVGSGLLGRAGALLAPILPHKRCVILTDQHVAALHLPTLRAGLAETGFTSSEIVVTPGEASKSLATYSRLAEQILGLGIERRTAILALGGGVVGDLAGFLAATLLRGLPFVQLPTSLLAQVDSSVGGKTGVNSTQGKNLIGAFHQPVLVLADTDTLATLDPREMRAGYAEIVKTALIGDAPFFAWCEQNGAALLAGDSAAQAEAVERACAFKAAVVAADEREESPEGGRALLNLGHTFGHALEAEYGYTGTMLHGEAVAIGCALAFRLSAQLGLCPPEDAQRVAAHLEAVGLEADLRGRNRTHSAEALIAHMARDKKVRDGKLRFVLARGIGAAFTVGDVEMTAVAQMLRDAGCAA